MVRVGAKASHFFPPDSTNRLSRRPSMLTYAATVKSCSRKLFNLQNIANCIIESVRTQHSGTYPIVHADKMFYGTC